MYLPKQNHCSVSENRCARYQPEMLFSKSNKMFFGYFYRNLFFLIMKIISFLCYLTVISAKTATLVPTSFESGQLVHTALAMHYRMFTLSLTPLLLLHKTELTDQARPLFAQIVCEV